MRERRNFISVIKGLKDLLDLMKRAFRYTASATITGQSFNQ